MAFGVSRSRARNCHSPISSSGSGLARRKTPPASQPPAATTTASLQSSAPLGGRATSSSSISAQALASKCFVFALKARSVKANSGTGVDV